MNYSFLSLIIFAELLASCLERPLFAVGVGRLRIPVFLVTVFAGAVGLLSALQHFRGVFSVYRIERQRCGVMQTMRKRDPSMAVLID